MEANETYASGLPPGLECNAGMEARTMENRVLIVDDDDELCGLVAEYLEGEGFDVAFAHDGGTGLERALANGYDLVVLDVMLPVMNGFEVLRRLRAESSVPVIMLTARGNDVDRIVGLEIGADDYIPKPFNSRELVARIRAILRRAGRAAEAVSRGDDRIRVGDVDVDRGSRVARRGGESLDLTTVEFDLLDVFLRNVGRVVPREELSTAVLGRDLAPLDRSIDVHVSNLRKKLGRAPGDADRIKAVRGVGYLYARPVATDSR
jgi:DNA-binding response OmpR family regulator